MRKMCALCDLVKAAAGIYSTVWQFLMRGDRLRELMMASEARSLPNGSGARSVHVQVRRYTPFGGGIRNCLGQQLARMNVPTAVAMFVGNFHLQLTAEVRCMTSIQSPCHWHVVAMLCDNPPMP